MESTLNYYMIIIDDKYIQIYIFILVIILFYICNIILPFLETNLEFLV